MQDAAAYGTTRAASNMVVAKYAKLLEKEGFLVVGFCPGAVNTTATADDPGERIRLASLNLMTRLRLCLVHRVSWSEILGRYS